nr:hypothetical protein [Prolixibacter sp. NT017]
MAKILTTRLLESIREDKSSVYYIGAQPSFNKLPEPEYTMTIYYGTAPEKIDTLKTAVFDESRICSKMVRLRKKYTKQWKRCCVSVKPISVKTATG